MSLLLKKIRNTNREAARVLEQADLRTNSDILSLTREDLHDLFPGANNFKLRQNLFEIIHEQKPVDVLFKELKAFIPRESFRAALTNNGVLVDYLHILKDMKAQMDNVQAFLDAHIGLLEELSRDQPDQESDKGSLSGTSMSDTYSPMEQCNGQTSSQPQGAEGSFVNITPQEAVQDEVICQIVVSGKTLGAHEQLMATLKAQVHHTVYFVERSDQHHQITIVFCPITSRIGSDVEAAMSDVKDEKPVILVLMHHERTPKYTPSVRTWSHNATQIVLYADVFFHEEMYGLLTCRQNEDAYSKIVEKLLEYAPPRCQDTSGRVLGVDAKSGRTGSTTVRGGGNNRGSNTDSGGYFFSGLFKSGK